MVLTGENCSTGRTTCSIHTLFTINSTWTGSGSKLATTRPSTAYTLNRTHKYITNFTAHRCQYVRQPRLLNQRASVVVVCRSHCRICLCIGTKLSLSLAEDIRHQMRCHTLGIPSPGLSTVLHARLCNTVWSSPMAPLQVAVGIDLRQCAGATCRGQQT
jgi:hypothetical protein